jgi:hypothetical protein
VEKYSLLIIGDSKIGGDGHFPIPTGCRNRDFSPPKFVFDGGGAAKLFWEKRRLI